MITAFKTYSESPSRNISLWWQVKIKKVLWYWSDHIWMIWYKVFVLMGIYQKMTLCHFQCTGIVYLYPAHQVNIKHIFYNHLQQYGISWHCSLGIFPYWGKYGIGTHCLVFLSRDQSRYAPSQWETLLQCKAITHWLGAYLLIPACPLSAVKW